MPERPGDRGLASMRVGGAETFRSHHGEVGLVVAHVTRYRFEGSDSHREPFVQSTGSCD